MFPQKGFYYMKSNPKTLFFQERMLKSTGEINYTHSHQSTVIRHLTETHSLHDIKMLVLDTKKFPSGQMYHHAKPYIRALKAYEIVPYVFHMCWTANRDQKVLCIVFMAPYSFLYAYTHLLYI